ncbi:hypothetical protein AB0C65_35575 [Nocardia sp. NPDC048505]|uniref:hypothetical protein n=1 Tax=Nocardia sp. NPDC048505 TaxID=3155756 RepID=UPI0033D87293
MLLSRLSAEEIGEFQQLLAKYGVVEVPMICGSGPLDSSQFRAMMDVLEKVFAENSDRLLGRESGQEAMRGEIHPAPASHRRSGGM